LAWRPGTLAGRAAQALSAVADNSPTAPIRDAIPDVAQDMFLEERFAAFMSTIASRLGGSKGTHDNYLRARTTFSAYVERRRLWQQDEIFEVMRGERR
jgi:hypothetical protein